MKKRNGRAEHHRPAFQFYPADFLADAAVVAMTMQERGVYITLLCHQWIEGSIPADPAIIGRLVHLEPEVMREVWASVSPKFQPTDIPGRLANARLERERAYMLERSAERVKILEAARQKKTAAGISRIQSDENSGISRLSPGVSRLSAESAAGISRIQSEEPSGISRIPVEDAPKNPSGSAPFYDRPIIEQKSTYDRAHHYHSPHPHPHPQATLGSKDYSRKKSSADCEGVTRDADAPELVKKKQGRPRKPPTGDHADFARHWEQTWLQTRGVPYAYSAEDGIAAAQILKLKGSSLAEACLRASRMLHSSDPWIRSNASVRFLRSRWNQMASVSSNTPEPKGFAAIRQVLAESQEGQP